MVFTEIFVEIVAGLLLLVKSAAISAAMSTAISVMEMEQLFAVVSAAIL